MGGFFQRNSFHWKKPNCEAQNIKTYLQRQPESSDSMAAGACWCISSSSSNFVQFEDFIGFLGQRGKEMKTFQMISINPIYKSKTARSSWIMLDSCQRVAKLTGRFRCQNTAMESIPLTARINLWLMHLFQTWGKSQRTAAIFLLKVCFPNYPPFFNNMENKDQGSAWIVFDRCDDLFAATSLFAPGGLSLPCRWELTQTSTITVGSY